MKRVFDRSGGRSMVAVLAIVTAAWASPGAAQPPVEIPSPARMVRVSAPAVELGAGGSVTARIALDVLDGWHINANPASPDYMIPTEIRITNAAAVTAGAARYPAAKPLKLGFEESELSVWDGRVTIEVPLRAGAEATNGTHTMQGRIVFQACNDQLCLAPANVPFTIDVTVTGGAAPGAGPPAGADEERTGTPPTADTIAAPPPDTAAGIRTEGFTQGPPAGGAAAAATLDNPLARALDRGGLAAFATLFLIGLALNLTPCVYPMLGVTVSIFGARRAAPPLQVFGLASLYVLGMATMYSVLGLIAAFTGGLFGAFLQNPVVLVAIGALFIGMALSMFGVYEIQMPAFVRERASAVSAVGAAGVFLSGLLVGVFAAPCIGPPVVALLAIVGAKADPWFGFSSFFTLALGLGAPYLVLGTFSNLLQTLPRSGDWMEWVKQVFGVVLVALGAFYALLGIAPDLAAWVLPIALVAGGGYLGFIDTHADRRPRFRAFKRVAGAVAVVGGLAVVATAPKQTLPMQEFTPGGLQAALASGQVAMVDFSADWCVPCHELERFTFTDRRVILAARDLATFRADLTRYDSAEAESWRKQYGISGVPTVLFLAPDGRELRDARVEGFLPPDRFLEHIERAVTAAQRAGLPTDVQAGS